MHPYKLNRRTALKSSFAASLAATCEFLPYRRLHAKDDTVIELGSRRELFVDEFLIEQMTGAKLALHPPLAKDVAITCDKPWEGNTSAYYTLFEDNGLIRMFYRGSNFDVATQKTVHPEFVCYAESRDGLTFQKPTLGLVEFEGSKANNILRGGEGSHNFTPFKDQNPNCSSDARYKALAGATATVNGKNKACLRAYRSPDAIHWTLMREEPVITEGAFDSQNLAFWHPERSCYFEFHRQFRNGVREIMTSSSDDFLSWTQPEFLSFTDSPIEHLYTNAIRPYFRAPHLFVGFPTRFQPKNQQVEPVFMTSRDGRNFHRWAEPLIPITAPQDRDGNRSNYMTNGLFQLPGQDREISVYATEAYYAGPGSRVRRFTFRTDGFVSVEASQAQCEVLTKPLSFAGSHLSLNYAAHAGGLLQVEIQDVASRKPVPGFSLSDCQPLSGDEIQEFVKWRDDRQLSELANRPIRLRFVLQNSDLFAMQFSLRRCLVSQ